MNPSEYDKLFRVDREHWFYRGKRDIVRYWIHRFIQLERDDVLIDAGMGTGTWAVEMASSCKVVGIDDHDESLSLAAPRLESVGARCLKSGLTKVDLPSSTASVVTMMDVLEHVDEDEAALREMVRLTRPGGLLVVTVPAHEWLWSDWDEVLHHRRRYTKSGLLRLSQGMPVRVRHAAYFNTAMLLPIGLVRGFRRIRPVAPGAERLEDRIPTPWLNRMLHRLLVVTGTSRISPPMGVSLITVLQRI